MSDRTLTSDDIEALRAALAEDGNHHCRYGVDPLELQAALDFFLDFKEAIDDSKRTVRRWVIILALGIIALVLGAGIVSKFKELFTTNVIGS